MDRRFIHDALAALREAIGLRRYAIGNLISFIVAIAGAALVWLTGAPMTSFDTYIVGACALLAVLFLSMLQYAVSLYRERIPLVDLSFVEDTHPWVSKVEHAHVPRADGTLTQTPAHFFSVQVVNKSATKRLDGVRVELTDVEVMKNGLFHPAGFGETLTLAWAKHEPDGFVDRDIPSLGKYFANVISVNGVWNRIWIKCKTQYQTDQHLFREPGLYRLTVVATPASGAGKEIRLQLRWTGQWDQTWMKVDDGHIPKVSDVARSTTVRQIAIG
jgi:hypothetical protein